MQLFLLLQFPQGGLVTHVQLCRTRFRRRNSDLIITRYGIIRGALLCLRPFLLAFVAAEFPSLNIFSLRCQSVKAQTAQEVYILRTTFQRVAKPANPM